MSNKPHAALYGTVALLRAQCPTCGCMSFVIKEESACCGASIAFNPDNGIEARRMTDVYSQEVARKKRLGVAQKRAIVAQQQGRCFYCERRLGSRVLYRGKQTLLRTHFDHFIPLSFSHNSESGNFVAACHICNTVKGSMIFQNSDHARAYIAATVGPWIRPYALECEVAEE